jgi:hypothetical protein
VSETERGTRPRSTNRNTPNAALGDDRETIRRTRPMGALPDITSRDRILFAVFVHENKSQWIATPFLLTQSN